MCGVIPVWEAMDKEIIHTALVGNNEKFLTWLLGSELEKYPSKSFFFLGLINTIGY